MNTNFKNAAYVTVFVLLFCILIYTTMVYTSTGDGLYQAASFILLIILFNGTGMFVDILKGENVWHD